MRHGESCLSTGRTQAGAAERQRRRNACPGSLGRGVATPPAVPCSHCIDVTQITLHGAPPSPSVGQQADGSRCRAGRGWRVRAWASGERHACLPYRVYAIADNLPGIVDGICMFQCPAGGRINQRVQVSHRPITVEEGVPSPLLVSAYPTTCPLAFMPFASLVPSRREAYPSQSSSHYCRGRRAR